MSIGRFPDVSLAKARVAALQVRSEVADKADPAKARHVEREEAREALKLETVSQIGDRYFADAETGKHRPNGRPKRPRTIALEKSYFEKHIRPRFGKDRLADLSRARIQALVNETASKSAARQVRVVLHAIFEFAIWQELAPANPCRFVSVAGFDSRERVLTDAELRSIWQALSAPEAFDTLYISRPITLALMLCAVTLQRRAEVAEARIEEFDLERREWLIPGARTKNRRAHLVPLSDLAVKLIVEAVGLAGKSGFLFPSPHGGADDDRPVTPAALSHAFRRLAAKIKLKNARPHDLRRTGATGLAKMGVRRFDISLVLNHTSDTGGGARVTGIYARHDHVAEKRAALDAWAVQLQKVVA